VLLGFDLTGDLSVRMRRIEHVKGDFGISFDYHEEAVELKPLEFTNARVFNRVFNFAFLCLSRRRNLIDPQLRVFLGIKLLDAETSFPDRQTYLGENLSILHVVEGEQVHEGVDVFEFGSEASPNHVVRVDHTLHQLALKICVWHVRLYQEPLPFLQVQDVH